MPQDPAVQRLAAAQGLDVVNVAWEDVGRFKGSSARRQHLRPDDQVLEQGDARGESWPAAPDARDRAPGLQRRDGRRAARPPPRPRRERARRWRAPCPCATCSRISRPTSTSPARGPATPESLLAPREHARARERAGRLPPFPAAARRRSTPCLQPPVRARRTPLCSRCSRRPRARARRSSTTAYELRGRADAGPAPLLQPRRAAHEPDRPTRERRRRGHRRRRRDAAVRPAGGRPRHEHGAARPGAAEAAVPRARRGRRGLRVGRGRPGGAGVTGRPTSRLLVIGHGADEGPFTE